MIDQNIRTIKYYLIIVYCRTAESDVTVPEDMKKEEEVLLDDVAA